MGDGGLSLPLGPVVGGWGEGGGVFGAPALGVPAPAGPVGPAVVEAFAGEPDHPGSTMTAATKAACSMVARARSKKSSSMGAVDRPCPLQGLRAILPALPSTPTLARRSRRPLPGPRDRLRSVTIERGDLARVAITPSESGSRLRLRVKPGAKRRAIEGEHGGALRVAVPAPPEKGRANQEVEELLAEALDVARAAVRVFAGHASRDKSVAI